jgi:hypothetical protein
MKVCQLGLIVAALVVAGMTGVSQAADGRPSDATLAAMGLADLNVMSDSESLSVRGLGWSGSSAYGQSFAVVASNGAVAGSKNGYNASGKKVAGGSNLSFAEVEVKHGGGHGRGCYDPCAQPKSVKVKAIAGGSSIGFRK